MGSLPACMSANVNAVPTEASRGHRIPWNLSYRWLWASMSARNWNCVLERTVDSLNCWIISWAPCFVFKSLCICEHPCESVCRCPQRPDPWVTGCWDRPDMGTMNWIHVPWKSSEHSNHYFWSQSTQDFDRKLYKFLQMLIFWSIYEFESSSERTGMFGQPLSIHSERNPLCLFLIFSQ